jgi:hypothetical protein
LNRLATHPCRLGMGGQFAGTSLIRIPDDIPACRWTGLAADRVATRVSTEMAATEMAAAEMAITEVSVTEVSVTEVSVTEVSVTEMAITEVSVTEVAATVTATHMSATAVGGECVRRKRQATDRENCGQREN